MLDISINVQVVQSFDDFSSYIEQVSYTYTYSRTHTPENI